VDQLSIELHFSQVFLFLFDFLRWMLFLQPSESWQHKTNAQGPNSGVREVFDFFEIVEAAGLRAFSWEVFIARMIELAKHSHTFFSTQVNHNPSGYWGEKPWAVEYSFIRPSSDFISQSPVSPLDLK
jgi:hypothetical protein